MRTFRILLTTAGAGNAINVVRSLKGSKLHGFKRRTFIIGANINKMELAKSNADKNYIIPKFDSKVYINSISDLIEKEKIDFMIPNHEFEIATIVRSQNPTIMSKCFLPSKNTVELCIDKYKLIKKLDELGFERNIPKSFKIKHYDEIYNDPHYNFPLWIRLTRGAGSRGATLIRNLDELKFWINYWVTYNYIDASDFMGSEYLPGRDYHYFSLWKDGEMVIGKSIERLQYCCAKYTLTGTSSSPSVCKTICDPKLDYLAQSIVRSIDDKANGLFGIDFKCNKYDIPCLTEINIGRFPRINYIFNHVGPNMAELYTYCGLGIKFKLPKNTMKLEKDWYLFRDFDLGLILKSEDDINRGFQNI